MKEELFEELLESVKQGGAILRGEMEPGRAFEFDPPDKQEIGTQSELSQEKFAKLLGIIKPLSRTEKLQLIADITRMLQEEEGDESSQDVTAGQEVRRFGSVNEPQIASQLQEMLTT